jgi:hypothetical protein
MAADRCKFTVLREQAAKFLYMQRREEGLVRKFPINGDGTLGVEAANINLGLEEFSTYRRLFADDNHIYVCVGAAGGVGFDTYKISKDTFTTVESGVLGNSSPRPMQISDEGFVVGGGTDARLYDDASPYALINGPKNVDWSGVLEPFHNNYNVRRQFKTSGSSFWSAIITGGIGNFGYYMAPVNFLSITANGYLADVGQSFDIETYEDHTKTILESGNLLLGAGSNHILDLNGNTVKLNVPIMPVINNSRNAPWCEYNGGLYGVGYSNKLYYLPNYLTATSTGDWIEAYGGMTAETDCIIVA